MRRTGGPHPSQTLPVANHPTLPCCLNTYLRARPNVRCLHCSPLSGDYLTLQHACTARPPGGSFFADLNTVLFSRRTVASEAMESEPHDPVRLSNASEDAPDLNYQGGAPMGWHGQSRFEHGLAQEPVQPVENHSFATSGLSEENGRAVRGNGGRVPVSMDISDDSIMTNEISQQLVDGQLPQQIKGQLPPAEEKRLLE